MVRKEHRFNPQTLTYEVITAPFRLRTYRLLRKIIVGFIAISILNALFSYFFYTPKIYHIHRANQKLAFKYQILQDRLSASERKIAEIRHRDQSVYRALFSTDTLHIDGIYTEYPSEKYQSMADDNYSSLMIDTWKQLDAFARQLYLESVSFDQLQVLAKNKEKLSSAIPAIWPIDRNKLRNGIGAFGMRRHPIYGRYIMHKGIDLACNVGDDVYATGDGVVESVDLSRAHHGYGTFIVINHKFGYKTRYAHLDKVHVKKGDHVVRGQLIADAGRTGGVTGPHLHYEVMYMGQVVNPINYFNKDMTPEEYNKIMEVVHETTLETD
jgi:murein DD-endopeptidase MepM/ murein hydrolase activator NlpD